MKNKKNGFTLAEVLVTLSILGVVAAISIPNIIGHYKKTMTETKLKMVYSQLSNIVDQINIEYGPVSQLLGDSIANHGGAVNGQEYFTNTYLEKYLNYTKSCKRSEDCLHTFDYLDVKNFNNNESAAFISRTSNHYVLKNGTYLSTFWIGGRNIGIALDINGKKGPNRFGYDVFVFTIHGTPAPDDDTPYILKNDVDCGRTYAYDRTIITWDDGGTCTGNGYACTCPIMRNNWKIPDDYPVKF